MSKSIAPLKLYEEIKSPEDAETGLSRDADVDESRKKRGIIQDGKKEKKEEEEINLHSRDTAFGRARVAYTEAVTVSDDGGEEPIESALIRGARASNEEVEGGGEES